MEGILTKPEYLICPELTTTTQDSSMRSLQIPSSNRRYLTVQDISDFLVTLRSNAESIIELSLGNNSYSEGVLSQLCHTISKSFALNALDVSRIFPEWEDSQHLEGFGTLSVSYTHLTLPTNREV